MGVGVALLHRDGGGVGICLVIKVLPVRINMTVPKRYMYWVISMGLENKVHRRLTSTYLLSLVCDNSLFSVGMFSLSLCSDSSGPGLDGDQLDIASIHPLTVYIGLAP